MIKRMMMFTAALVLLLGLCACGHSASGQADRAEQLTWQEQYDLGLRYLDDGNYEEAILAFTAAIEIDPKQALAYVGRGDAYVASVSGTEITAQTLEFTGAEADYLTAIELDASTAAVYGKLAELYLAVGNVDRAIVILEQGYQATGDETLNSRRQELRIVDTDEVVWTDPVFEQLVRSKLGIPTGPVHVQDLNEITNLTIYGDSVVFINDDALTDWGLRYVHMDNDDSGTLDAYYGKRDGTKYTTRGGITNVDTLKYFQNLRSVQIIANHISDISILDQLNNLTVAYFWANDIADLSLLERMPNYDPQNAEQFVEIGDTIMIHYNAETN